MKTISLTYTHKQIDSINKKCEIYKNFVERKNVNFTIELLVCHSMLTDPKKFIFD